MRKRIIFLIGLLINLSAWASHLPPLAPGTWAGSLSIRSKSVTNWADPSDIRGARLGLEYHPDYWIHKQLHLFFDASYAAYRSDRDWVFDSVNAFSIAGVFRFYFWQSGRLTPYIEGSIGPAYLNSTQLGQQKVGIRYTFQDRIALGCAFGQNKLYTLALSSIHYSNADISRYNDGMTAPICLMASMRLS